MKYNAETLKLLKTALAEIEKINKILDETFPRLFDEMDGYAIEGVGLGIDLNPISI